MINLTPLINAFIAVVAALLAAYTIPWIKSKTTAVQREQMLEWVEIAVMAAQQVYHHMDGASRKAYVLQFLASKGYNIESSEIDKAIEAAVLKLHQELEAVG